MNVNLLRGMSDTAQEACTPPTGLRNLQTALSIGVIAAALICISDVASTQSAVPEKMYSYRVTEMETGRETYRETNWRQADGSVPATWNEKKYADGSSSIDECLFANSYEKPATAIRSVVTRGAELESSDFDVFDPAFYPFLRQPLPESAQPGACAGVSVDQEALVQGKAISITAWSETGYAVATLRPVENETITVPAGTYESLRVTQDLDLSDYLARLPLIARHFVKTPVVTNWMMRTPPYDELKSTTLEGSGAESKTLRELTGVAELPTSPPSAPLNVTQQIQPDPVPRIVNAGTITQGALNGRVTLSATATRDGELLVVRIAFSNGIALEDRSLLDTRAPPFTRYLEQRTYAPDGKLVRRRLSYVREHQPSEETDAALPSPLYPYATTLAIIMPRMLSDPNGTVGLHVIGNGGGVSELVLSGSGYETLELEGCATKALHARLRPKVDVPLLLRPIAYFFIPQYDVYFDANMPSRLLKFDGPLGPPGVPEAHMVADPKVSTE